MILVDFEGTHFSFQSLQQWVETRERQAIAAIFLLTYLRYIRTCRFLRLTRHENASGKSPVTLEILGSGKKMQVSQEVVILDSILPENDRRNGRENEREKFIFKD